jgi:hypothetical protein
MGGVNHNSSGGNAFFQSASNMLTPPTASVASSSSSRKRTKSSTKRKAATQQSHDNINSNDDTSEAAKAALAAMWTPSFPPEEAVADLYEEPYVPPVVFGAAKTSRVSKSTSTRSRTSASSPKKRAKPKQTATAATSTMTAKLTLLADCKSDMTANVICLIRRTEAVTEVLTKFGNVVKLCRLTVGDPSRRFFEVSLWNYKTQWSHELQVGDVALFQDLDVKTFKNNICGSTRAATSMTRLYKHWKPVPAPTTTSSSSTSSGGGSGERAPASTSMLRDTIVNLRSHVAKLFPTLFPSIASSSPSSSTTSLSPTAFFLPTPLLYLSTLNEATLQCHQLRVAILLEWGCTAEGGLLDPYLLPSTSHTTTNSTNTNNNIKVTFTSLDELTDGCMSHVSGRVLECDRPLPLHQRPPQTMNQLRAAAMGVNNTRTKYPFISLRFDLPLYIVLT